MKERVLFLCTEFHIASRYDGILCFAGLRKLLHGERVFCDSEIMFLGGLFTPFLRFFLFQMTIR